jgi:hypothetical protein
LSGLGEQKGMMRNDTKMQMENCKSPALVRLKQEAQAGCRKGVRHSMNE